MDEHLPDKVRRGALVLDRLVPKWEHRVDLDNLKMESGTLCMLGQLFGYNVETSIGKEMYPELWEQQSKESYEGYMIGRRIIGQLLGVDRGDLWHAEDDCDAAALRDACRETNARDSKCLWVAEVAERRARSEADNNTTLGEH